MEQSHPVHLDEYVILAIRSISTAIESWSQIADLISVNPDRETHKKWCFGYILQEEKKHELELNTGTKTYHKKGKGFLKESHLPSRYLGRANKLYKETKKIQA